MIMFQKVGGSWTQSTCTEGSRGHEVW